MTRDRTALLAIFISLLAACSHSGLRSGPSIAVDPRGQESCLRPGESAPAIDAAHPASFVSIHEITPDGKRIPIFLPARCVSGPKALERVNAPVGNDSRIEIRFVRDLLEKTPSDIDLMVRGSLLTGGAEKQLAIRNYSAVGEKSTPATARVRASSDIAALINGLAVTNNLLDLESTQLVARSGNAEAAREETVHREIESHRDKIAGLQREIDPLATVVSRLRADSANFESRGVNPPLPPDSANRRSSVVDSLRVLSNQAASVAAGLETERGQLANAEKELLSLHSDSVLEQFRANNVSKTRSQLLGFRGMLEVPLQMIADSASRPVLVALLSDSRASVDQVIQLARAVTDTWFPDLAQTVSDDSDTSRSRALLDVERIKFAVNEIRRSFGDQTVPVIRGKLVEGVRDTDLMVEETGARPGDVIILTIRNGESNPQDRRDLQVRLRVASYGLSAMPGEAFSLVNRISAPTAEANELQIDALRSRLVNQGLATGLALADSVMEVQEPHRWAPAYSFTSGWVYRARPANPLTTNAPFRRRWYNAVAWLQPSFGLQLALPKFQTQRVTFHRQLVVTPVSEGATAHADTAVTVSNPEITDVNRGLDVALGGYVGAWNNMLVLGYGWHLTADSPRRYVSVGLSFVRIAQTAIQALSGAN